MVNTRAKKAPFLEVIQTEWVSGYTSLLDHPRPAAQAAAGMQNAAHSLKALADGPELQDWRAVPEAMFFQLRAVLLSDFEATGYDYGRVAGRACHTR